MKPLISPTRLLKSIAALTLAATAFASTASATTLGLPLFYTTGINLGAAGWRFNNAPFAPGGVLEVRNYAILTLGGGTTVTATTGSSLNPTVVGDIGVNSGNLSISGNAFIRGHGLVRTGGGLVRSGLAQLNPVGLTTTQADGSVPLSPSTLPTVAVNTIDPQLTYGDNRLGVANIDATLASNAAAALPTLNAGLFSIPVTTMINQATNFSLTAPSSRVVLNLTDFVITAGATFDIYGDNQTSLVINVSNNFSLVGGKIVLHGVLGGSVLFNVIGTGTAVTLTSGARIGDTAFDTPYLGNDTQNAAIILATQRQVNLSGSATLNGTLIARSASISGNSRVIKPVWVSP